MSGGGSSTPSTTSTNMAELPEWARGYAKDTLYKASQLTDINKNPYQQYTQNRIAGFSPLQEQAQQGAAGMQPNKALDIGQYLAAKAGSQSFASGNTAANFMSPYMQNVVDIQKREAQRQSGIQGTQQQAQAAQAGAFGGGRDAIMRAERERNLGTQMNDIQAMGSQNAFQNAQQQFNAENQMGLQAANQLGALGQAQYGQQMGINQLQNQYGAQQQALAQQGLSQGYQDFLNQQNYPYKQLGFMSDMVRGLPLGQQSTAQMYQAPPSMLQNVAGAGMGAYGLKQLGMFAEGGQVKGYASGGELNPMDDPNRMTAAVSKLSDEQLQQIIQHPSSAAEKQAAQLELATRASEKQGLASAYNAIPSAANGGMVAFGKGGIMHFDGEYGSQVEDPNAQNDEDQIPGTMGNPELQEQLRPLLLAAARRAANAEPFQGSNETEEQGVTREMNLVNRLAGPSPYDEVKTQVADLTSQAKDALQQGKGIAALSAMGAIMQGPNFMRALGGAGQAFADSYKGALASNQAAKMSIAQMNINLANGQRAEKLGLVKDAMGSYQAAKKNQVDAYKAQQEANYKALRGLAYAERAAQPPKAAAAPKPSAQAEGVAILAADLQDQHPDWSPAKINASALTLYNQQKAAGLPGVQAAVQGRADVASSEADLKWAQTVNAEVDKRIAAMSIADYGRNPEYRKDPVGYKLKLAETVRKAVLADPNFQKPGSTAAPAPAPARPAAPATRLRFDSQGNQVQ